MLERSCLVSRLFKEPRNMINEYMSWVCSWFTFTINALSHSHSPLVFDDAMSRSSLSSHFDESNIPISSSWVSDGARSDASHVLYKELDPLNKATSMELDKENNTVFYKEGSWITVAEPSNGKYATSVSNYHFSKLLLIGLRSLRTERSTVIIFFRGTISELSAAFQLIGICGFTSLEIASMIPPSVGVGFLYYPSSISHYIMPPNTEQTPGNIHRDDKRNMVHPLVEEVDGLELARLARRLWDHKKTKYGKSVGSIEKAGNKSYSKSTPLGRPTVLRLRSTPQTALPDMDKSSVSSQLYLHHSYYFWY
ncbi:unnamed protein product [Schistosoma mattheei]|uniref:Uncharacterized protein n=1 Tax=Schistosoma mattheei TaxID=31246 RepID=A0A3P8EFS8_9TREM|nr:unnamed protein product [Schistosoma mattheei]